MADWVYVLGFGAFAIVGHAVVAIVALTGAGKPARQDPSSGELIKEYGIGARILAISLGMFPVPIILAALLFEFRALEREARTWLFILGFFLVFSLPFTIEFFGVSHRIAQPGIRKGSPGSRKFFARWEEFISVKYSAAFEGYIVKTARGTIRISRHFRGINQFRARMAEREREILAAMFAPGKIAEDVYLKKRQELDQLYGVTSSGTDMREE